MELRFAPGPWERLETDPKFGAGLPADVVKLYRKRVNFIRNAADERDLRGMKSLHFEKLEGRGQDRSIRLNDQWRLILQLEGDGSSKTVVIVGIEDYH